MAYDITKMQDITISEKTLWAQYISLIIAGDIVGANEIITNNPKLKYKALNAFNFGRLCNLVNDTTDTESSTENSLVGRWDNDFSLLEVAGAESIYIGEWDSVTAYKKGNIIIHGSGYENIAYLCISDNTNFEPPNAQYWLLAQENAIASKLTVSESEPASNYIGNVWFSVIS